MADCALGFAQYEPAANLFITGSVAALIRRIARDAGTRLGVWRFSAPGAALVPVPCAAGAIGSPIVWIPR